ncbi:MAG: tRNA lysidine(34) synthetase TilS [Cardiobacteriaceae bacterium]|nr:tRNA lysidine(34) synthetase TilS [Cardiobacteriaceae bacterium]
MNFSEPFLHWQVDYRPAAFLLAFSGGRDSVAMLDWLSRMDLAAPLSLCHVHHGWRAEADDWADWCVAKAADYGVACAVVRVEAHGARGESVEAVARAARYQALAARLPPRGVLLTAHHQDDQAETFLLAALRGSGVQGLAAMPGRKAFARGEHWRPWLAVPRAAIDAYVAERNLDFLDDPSNAEMRFRRNALRHQVLPLLDARALALSAQRAGEDLAVQQWLLDRLLPEALENPLPWRAFVAEPPALQAAVVRRFLQRAGLPMPPGERLAEWLRQVRMGGGEPLLAYGEWRLVFYRDEVFLYREVAVGDAPAFAPLTLWAGVGELRVSGVDEGEWALARGGMRFNGKTLKDAFQKAGIPRFERARTPVLLVAGEAVWAGGLGCARGVAGLVVEWQKKPWSVSIRR